MPSEARGVGAPETEVASHLMQVLGTKPGSSALSALNH